MLPEPIREPREAYHEGYNAFVYAVKYSHPVPPNPYPTGSSERQQWEDGKWAAMSTYNST